MEKKPRREGLLEKTAELFDLPADALAGLPKVELVGDRELRIENHRGILAYGTEALELRAMTGLELLITGRIAGIQLA